MGRMFPLAGLLRLRQVQRDQAAGDLAAANARVERSSARERTARAALAGIAAEVSDVTVLSAIAAARASSRGMLGELQAIEEGERARARQAADALGAARARSIALEKLEGRFVAEAEGAELLAEQASLDEIAGTGWYRAAGQGS